ncbi:MAG: acyl-ACP--UDP-N-acetylglucosamine O-acyltransferase [Candidatus Saganbacteria bacterium]|nr:acyl-ACP--UDP-N-acetylglucosamine O-acyltransferase [Candidatus Saganbacteria bacterium]
MLNIQDILRTIPHRYPFLLIDKIIELEDEKRAVGIKNVTINEHFFQGHFPGQPIMPGVLIIEALAQVGAVLALRMPSSEGKIIYFGGIDKVRFRKPVVPGDQLRLEAQVLWFRRGIGKMKAIAKVGEDIAVEGDFTFSLVPQGAGGASIHPTATIHSTAKIGKGVKIGPYVVIGPEVEVGEETQIDAHTTISRWTKIGKKNHIFHSVAIGAAPQDVHYKGEKSQIVIGDKNTIREFVTIHLPTGEGNKTSIGSENLIMVHAHIPHNCTIGNHTVIGGYAGLAGHTEIQDQAIIGGMAGIHQFVRVGRLAMVGANSKIVQDIPPFMLVEGNPAQVRSINSIGMQRKGISQEAITEIKRAFKIIYETKQRTPAIVTELKKRLRPLDEVNQLIQFLETESRRGINKKVALEEIDEELIFPDIPELGI